MQPIGRGQPGLIARVALLCVAPMLVSSITRGQTPGELTGVITDPAGNPVFGAIVEIVGSRAKVRTDDKGEFRLTNLAAGDAEIQVRRLGFTPVNQKARIGAESSPLRIALTPAAMAVEPVLVQASRVQFSGRLAGYYERLHRHSNGSFINREQIDRNNNKTLSQLLSSAPGINANQRSSAGNVRMRGMRCRPLVWLDGVPLPAGEVDLNAFPVSSLHGIELYLGATNSPPAYTALNGQSSCGTILLWSRGSDTERGQPVQRAGVDVDEITADHGVYTSDQVDTPARLVGSELDVVYPPELAASKTGGSAVTEFVVSASGEIEKGSVGIVTATNPLFADAAIQALGAAHYSAALKGGVAVRQVVQQSFSFSLSSESASAGARR
jgi:Carboxypeptidase regulatory-like domain/TonB-dependent Receptor Plug Domain/Gram-negative bacterial TonB protein C-terminal